MPTIKLTKTVVDSATPEKADYELRDTITPGFLCKVTPKGRKVFMLQYRTNAGDRRKPAIGLFGELTVDQARGIAQGWLAEVRRGKDPSAEKLAARRALSMKELCDKFIEDYSIPKNRPSTVKGNRGTIKRYILPEFGSMKARDMTRADVAGLVARMKDKPTSANHVLSLLRKMFNMAEVWGIRDDGTNPCRHVPKYPEGKRTRLLSDDELFRIFGYMDRADADGLEHPFLTLAVRLHFLFAARMSEITCLEWAWIDFAKRRVVWPDSKTGEISKPMSEEAFTVLSAAVSLGQSDYVVPSIFDLAKPMSNNTYAKGWARILERADVPHVGSHGIRHRATTEIANSGVPIKVGMQLTAHKTVTMFMRYVHTEDEPVRAAAELVASRRRSVLQSVSAMAGEEPEDSAPTAASPPADPVRVRDGRYSSRTRVGEYRPYRQRSGANRAPPPKPGRAKKSPLVAAE
ncbi:tyrosine-type recombinase/integrase [Methylobacterium iners]|uniref:Integrase n=1 Tax=Methylobacterium iners TaxID=418707 RepID=A0ABQ4S6B2_9HYPH|nr:site-specific integrase [Methylobacterium iners]GJD97667.1 hypothetical protein OCOJLMKI_4900 [Methylobacterium iners]